MIRVGHTALLRQIVLYAATSDCIKTRAWQLSNNASKNFWNSEQSSKKLLTKQWQDVMISMVLAITTRKLPSMNVQRRREISLYSNTFWLQNKATSLSSLQTGFLVCFLRYDTVPGCSPQQGTSVTIYLTICSVYKLNKRWVYQPILASQISL